ncbi:hypothetical protein [Nonomuraea sp. NPDC049625]|uniref:hypothetical protein n=1 Tax=Nonomuraea sp. NPDC049625 TaxID=3155775 RepID=UPI00343954C0
MTSINDALVFSMNPALPFGGRGDSGYGRKHGGGSASSHTRTPPSPRPALLSSQSRALAGRPTRWRQPSPPQGGFRRVAGHLAGDVQPVRLGLGGALPLG